MNYHLDRWYVFMNQFENGEVVKVPEAMDRFDNLINELAEDKDFSPEEIDFDYHIYWIMTARKLIEEHGPDEIVFYGDFDENWINCPQCKGPILLPPKGNTCHSQHGFCGYCNKPRYYCKCIKATLD